MCCKYVAKLFANMNNSVAVLLGIYLHRTPDRKTFKALYCLNIF